MTVSNKKTKHRSASSFYLHILGVRNPSITFLVHDIASNRTGHFQGHVIRHDQGRIFVHIQVTLNCPIRQNGQRQCKVTIVLLCQSLYVLWMPDPAIAPIVQIKDTRSMSLPFSAMIFWMMSSSRPRFFRNSVCIWIAPFSY